MPFPSQIHSESIFCDWFPLQLLTDSIFNIQAEKHLKSLKKSNPREFYEGISKLIMNSKEDHVRSFSAVLLKQNLGIFDETFFKLPADSQKNIKSLLLNQIKCEANQNVVSQIAEAVSHLTCLVMQKRSCQWKELMPFLVSLSKSNTASERAAFYITIDKLACNAMDILRESKMEELRDILCSGLQDKDDNVRECALSAVVSLLCGLNEPKELNYFQKVVPLLFHNINTNIGDNTICKTCESLQLLTENQPEFFANSMEPIVKCLVAVTRHNTLEWDTRKLSMNLLVTLLDLHMDHIRERTQNNGQDVAAKVVPLLFDFMSTFDESLEWNRPEDDVEQSGFQFGAELMPVLVSIFGADVFLNIAQSLFNEGFADNAHWKKKMIALKTVEVTLEGCVEKYESQLQHIMNATGKSLSHENNHVKYAALSVIKQLSVVFGEDKHLFLEPFAAPIMKAFCSMLDTPQQHHRCVLIQVCDALAHFAYMDDENEIIQKYTAKVLKGLFNVLKCTDALMVSFGLKAISVIISVIQEHFGPFYKHLMAFCTNTLHKIYGGEMRDDNGLLRGRIMECIGGMLLVVDIDQCRDDAHKIIKYLLPFQEKEQRNSASESYSYMMPLFASIAEALTEEFRPYLKSVIPPLIASAKKKAVSIGMGRGDEDEQKTFNENSKVVMQEFGGIQFSVNTADVNEKSIAIQQFPRYAVCLEGEMLQFVKPITNVLVPIIKTRALSSEVRRHAIETFVPLVNCLKCGLIQKKLQSDQISKWVTDFVQELLAPLVEGMQISDEVDEFSLICKTIQDLLDYVALGQFKNAELISDITEQIKTAVNERAVRRQLNEEKSVDLIDADVEEDVEADLADTVVDLVAKLVQKFGPKYVEIFDKHCGLQCRDFLNVDGYEEDQILSLSMLTEMIQYGGDGAKIYVPAVLNVAQQYLGVAPMAASAQIRQSICYAVGVCATKKALNSNDTQKWLGLLKNLVNDDESRSEENQDATENAISAIGKICKSYILPITAGVRGSQSNIIVDWMRMLPLVNDEEERQFCDEYLMSLLKQSSLLKDMVEGKKVDLISKLLEIMAVSIVNGDKGKEQYQQLFAHLQTKCDSNVLQKCITGLSEENAVAFQQHNFSG